MEHFFDMGGYAGFIWPAYLVTAVVMVIVFVVTWRSLKTRERTLETLQAVRRRGGGRRRRRDADRAEMASAREGETTGDA